MLRVDTRCTGQNGLRFLHWISFGFKDKVQKLSVRDSERLYALAWQAQKKVDLVTPLIGPEAKQQTGPWNQICLLSVMSSVGASDIAKNVHHNFPLHRSQFLFDDDSWVYSFLEQVWGNLLVQGLPLVFQLARRADLFTV